MIKTIAHVYVFAVLAVTAAAFAAAVLYMLATIAALAVPALISLPALPAISETDSVAYSLLLIPAFMLYGAALDAAR